MVATQLGYAVLIALLLAERLLELRVSRRNASWALAEGGVERGQGHFRCMTLLHGTFFVACLAEVWLLGRPFRPWLGVSMLAVALLAQGLRYWAITALGRRWNTRILVLPGAPRIRTGPYRLVAHPNYVAVVIEGIALPLVHSAWITAAVFTVLNAALL
ncbi:MAG: hypothetical protein KDK70_44895, partial [Myxococcales bacterium]|nr:hypothetical protein [Myxococcales bacterium]